MAKTYSQSALYQATGTPSGTYASDDGLVSPTVGTEPNSWGALLNENAVRIDRALARATFLGEIRMYAGSSAPSGWALCDGSAIDQATYPQMYNWLVVEQSSRFGEAGGNPKLPDLRARFVLGAGAGTLGNDADGSELSDRTLASTGGRENVTLTESQLPGHTHSVYVQVNSASDFSGTNNVSTGATPSDTNSPYAGTKTGISISQTTHNHTGYTTYSATGITLQTSNYQAYGDNAYLTDVDNSQIASSSYLINDPTHMHQIPGDTANVTLNDPDHTHSIYAKLNSAANFTGTDNATASTGGGNAHDNMPPYIVLSYIIRIEG